MKTALLSSTYFGPIQWYRKIARYGDARVEWHDSYQKQTYRNRCIIANAHGLQTLTLPVERHTDGTIRISDHGQWRHQHSQALLSAYGESPFFDYYADDLAPFFERRWTFLYDYNLEICQTLCRLLDVDATIRPTERYLAPDELPQDGSIDDFRDSIHPKRPAPDADALTRPYYQVFADRHGFQPNLSILDLLFNMGPEGIFWLEEPPPSAVCHT